MTFRLVLILLFAFLPLTVLAGQKILVFGDSLSAAYGIPREAGWASLLDGQLGREYPSYRVINASIGGETTSGGLTRIGSELKAHAPAIVIIELGSNDSLRGLPIAQTRRNLALMIESCLQSRAKVLLVGMRIPPNYGIQYTRDFSATFDDLAKHYQLALVPFLLDGIAGHPELMQPDGLHPVASAQPRIMRTVWQALQPMLKR